MFFTHEPEKGNYYITTNLKGRQMTCAAGPDVPVLFVPPECWLVATFTLTLRQTIQAIAQQNVSNAAGRYFMSCQRNRCQVIFKSESMKK